MSPGCITLYAKRIQRGKRHDARQLGEQDEGDAAREVGDTHDDLIGVGRHGGITCG